MSEENCSSKNSITVELKVYMHCDACERSVRRAIKKVEGVETVEVDREENKVTVTGDFEAEKVVKKIKKKTGKKAEILIMIPGENEEEEVEPVVEDYGYGPYGDLVPLDPEQDYRYGAYEFQRPARWDLHYFDDENTEACRIM